MSHYYGQILDTAQLNQLLPYIYYLMDNGMARGDLKTAVGMLTVVAISDTEGAFSINGEMNEDALTTLYNIRILCEQFLQEDLVVIKGPIRHRVIFFSINDHNQMIVQHKDRPGSEHDSFEKTMQKIHKMFPDAVCLGG
ncbi:MAG: hypothetical protein KAR79_02580 [Simkaniaceae bacterium]|nr:hypothetical protein [Simkaniaceae bacterium]